MEYLAKNQIMSILNKRVEELLYLQKRNKENIVCKTLKIIPGDILKLSAELMVNEKHLFFFDHPLDHISGVQLIEAMLQIVQVEYLFKNGFDMKTPLFFSNVQVEFAKICRKETISKIIIEQVGYQGKDKGLSLFNGHVRDDTTILCKGEFRVSMLDDGETHNPSALQQNEYLADNRIRPCPKEFVHKNNPINVFISEPTYETESANKTNPYENMVFTIIPVGSHPFFSDYIGPHVPFLYLLEAFRQTQRYIDHVRKNDNSFFLSCRSYLVLLGIELKRPIFRSETVHLIMKKISPQQIGRNMLVSTNSHIVANGDVVGSCNVKSIIVGYKGLAN